MAQKTQIVAELKRALRSTGHTYADVAKALGLSVASVKRLFSTEDLSLQRVDQICELVGLSLRDILERALERSDPIDQLTLAQESQVIADPSFHNWFGLALSLREQQISDFPLCNKSFNLSYCGHDL